ncbi:TPA: TrbC/VirB2 family protein [Salmonella enterica]
MFKFIASTFKVITSKINTIKIKNTISVFFICTIVSTPAFAGGGLNAATSALTDIKVWLFGFVGVGALCYLLWCIGMALAEKKQWSDVGMALVYCTLAGGAVVGGSWALDLFQ